MKYPSEWAILKSGECDEVDNCQTHTPKHEFGSVYHDVLRIGGKFRYRHPGILAECRLCRIYGDLVSVAKTGAMRTGKKTNGKKFRREGLGRIERGGLMTDSEKILLNAIRDCQRELGKLTLGDTLKKLFVRMENAVRMWEKLTGLEAP